MKNELLTSVALPPREKWRCKLHAKELLDCGFDPSSEDGGWSVIKGILKAKGVPEQYTADGADFSASEVDDGILLEFGG